MYLFLYSFLRLGQCGLSNRVLDWITKSKFDKPTPIQAQVPL